MDCESTEEPGGQDVWREKLAEPTTTPPNEDAIEGELAAAAICLPAAMGGEMLKPAADVERTSAASIDCGPTRCAEEGKEMSFKQKVETLSYRSYLEY